MNAEESVKRDWIRKRMENLSEARLDTKENERSQHWGSEFSLARFKALLQKPQEVTSTVHHTQDKSSHHLDSNKPCILARIGIKGNESQSRQLKQWLQVFW
ncbi:hypothetical protein VNO77_07890 [Canavalia gladiata]|uniref:Uncharacterized protein n=1 Tax=Canavalia gladiata TaxID=3824 RepID=A0AAN9QWV1_CANGL